MGGVSLPVVVDCKMDAGGPLAGSDYTAPRGGEAEARRPCGRFWELGWEEGQAGLVMCLCSGHCSYWPVSLLLMVHYHAGVNEAGHYWLYGSLGGPL